MAVLSSNSPFIFTNGDEGGQLRIRWTVLVEMGWKVAGRTAACSGEKVESCGDVCACGGGYGLYREEVW